MDYLKLCIVNSTGELTQSQIITVLLQYYIIPAMQDSITHYIIKHPFQSYMPSNNLLVIDSINKMYITQWRFV